MELEVKIVDIHFAIKYYGSSAWKKQNAEHMEAEAWQHRVAVTLKNLGKKVTANVVATITPPKGKVIQRKGSIVLRGTYIWPLGEWHDKKNLFLGTGFNTHRKCGTWTFDITVYPEGQETPIATRVFQETI